MDCVPDIPLEEVFIDSPILRERIQAVQTDLDDFCQELRKLHSTAKLYIQAGQTFARLGQALADEMLSFKVRRCEGDESPRFQHFMMQMGSVTKEIESARQILFYETEKFLLKPIEYFLISEYEECKESRRNYEKTRATYDSFVEKNCTTPGKKEKFRQEYEDHRLQLSDMTFDYVRIMTEFEKRKRFEFMERMSLYAQENIRFLETGLSQLNTIRPQFEELHQFCQKEKDSLDTLRVDAVEKRRKKIIRQKSVMYLMKTPKKVTKEGYLYKKSRNISIKDWNRRYFVISNGHMFYYRQHKDNEPQGTINLMLTTVKEVNTNDHTYCMEVISNQRAYVLQAESLQELRDWISVIQNCTATLLEAQTIGHATASDEDDPLYNLWAAHPKNRECVDCGARDPDWVSINLGVLMCIGCSGIHRSLGVHISKVRSLTLDRCDPQLLEFMKAIGNHFANSVFEAGVVTKLTDSSNRSEKQSYIHDKYVGKKFVPRFSGSQEELDEEFYRSMVDGDVRKAYNLLAYGANLDSARNPTGNAPIFTAISSKNAVCIDLLLLNDADLRAHDKTGFTPIHSAVQTMDLAILQQVLSRGGRYDQPCGPGPYERMTPLDIASSIGFTEAVRILKTHKTGTDLDTIDGDGAGDLAASSRARPSFADSPAIAVLSVGDKSRSTSLNTSRPASESTGFFRRFSPHE